MVCDEAVAGLPIEAGEAMHALRVVRFLNDKAEVDGHALAAGGRAARCIRRATVGATKLFLETDWAVVKI